jgi:hypothetical protein
MIKRLFAIVVLMACVSAHAGITASTDGGTSSVHLGVLSMAECEALVKSPVIAGLQVAVDGVVTSPDVAKCRAAARVDLVSTFSAMTYTSLAKPNCVELAHKAVTLGTIRINGLIITRPDQVDPACSKASNVVTVPL